MSSFASFSIVYIFALIALVRTATPRARALSTQCWHESPFSTVNLHSSRDEVSEFTTKISPTSRVNSKLPTFETGVKKATNYRPWSHRPICTKVIPSLGSKLCVYTDATFGNGRGISIFTTPDLADEFVRLPAFQDPDALKDINVPSGTWYTQELPGKGIGMLAKRQLKFKDRVTAYTPAFVALLEHELETMEREKYYRVAVYQLPEATRENYLRLAFVYGQPSIRIQDIVKANTFQLQVGGHNHLSVFPETSRLNHACAPNAQYFIDPSLLTHFVHATRPIAPGEEITISYTSPLETTEMRQQHLREGFHFTCSCSRCSAKGATDAALDKILEMQNVLNDWSATSTATPKLAEKLLQLYRKEGLEGFLDVPYGYAALAYNAVGNSKKAAKYAEQAKEAILLKDGTWTPNMQIWVELLQDPKKHWSFKRRQR